ncbi:hypothetical protein AAVH_19194, partial [Aphelenchoides avenae]
LPSEPCKGGYIDHGFIECHSKCDMLEEFYKGKFGTLKGCREKCGSCPSSTRTPPADLDSEAGIFEKPKGGACVDQYDHVTCTWLSQRGWCDKVNSWRIFKDQEQSFIEANCARTCAFC